MCWALLLLKLLINGARAQRENNRQKPKNALSQCSALYFYMVGMLGHSRDRANVIARNVAARLRIFLGQFSQGLTLAQPRA